MRTNTATARTRATRTHAGAPARAPTQAQELRRAVLSCLLWEDQYYETGEKIADRIMSLALTLPPRYVSELAIEARTQFGLRHVPLWLIVGLARTGAGEVSLVADTIVACAKRADDITELVALYWKKNGRAPLPAQFKKGLARAFKSFDAYQLAKYDRATTVRLRDVMFLACPKPDTPDQAALWKNLAANELVAPDTWEVALSAGADKRETFTRLLQENRLGYLALLRNLRNMEAAGVDRTLVQNAILEGRGSRNVWPFRYVAAARACPSMEPLLNEALIASIEHSETLKGLTVILVDVSGSMNSKLSVRSDMTRMDAAAALASVIKCEDARIFTFSKNVVEVPYRTGMAGADAIIRSQSHTSTRLDEAVTRANQIGAQRLIVITDEQSQGAVPKPVAQDAYMIDVSGYRPSVAYGDWVRISGFSEAVIKFVHEYERPFLVD